MTENEGDETQLEDCHYEWITDLRLTEPFWQDWFQGLSAAFLSSSLHSTPKLLVLANYLLLECDRAICTAQMQGLFEMQFMQGGGHALMEDFPLHFARTLYRFLRRNQIVTEGGMVEGGGKECASPMRGGQQQHQQQQLLHRSRSESPSHHPPSAHYFKPPHPHFHSDTHLSRSLSPSSSTSSSSSSCHSPPIPASPPVPASMRVMHSNSGSTSSISSSSASSYSISNGTGLG